MKFLKSTITIVALFAIGSVSAKVMKKSTTTSTPISTSRPVIYDKPLAALPTVDVKKKTFDTNYVENKVNMIVQAKGFSIKNESNKIRENRLIGLVKNEIINDLTPETKTTEINDLKHLVNTTMHTIIANDVKRALMQYYQEEYMSER